MIDEDSCRFNKHNINKEKNMTLQGSLKYDSNRTYDGGGTGMPNIPIVLQNLDNGNTVAVLTDSNVNYTFTDVPDGNYQVVEKADWTPAPSAVESVSWNSRSAGKVITTGGVTPTLAQYPNVKKTTDNTANATDGVGETTKKFSVSGSNAYDNKGTLIDSNNNMYSRNKTVSSYLTINNGDTHKHHTRFRNDHDRRLSKDYEISTKSAENMTIISYIATLLKRFQIQILRKGVTFYDTTFIW